MSRSYKKTPIHTILGRMSQHQGKKIASRRFRRAVKIQLLKGNEVLPEKSTELTNTYDLGGDGKMYRPEGNWRRK